MRNLFGLTRLAPTLRTVLVEIAFSPLTIGLSHLINLGLPFLNSSNAWDCAWNIARIESGDLHLSMVAASGWLRRSCPVHLAYLAKAMSKRVSKLDSEEDVVEADDMVQWEGVGGCGGKQRRRGRGDSRVCPHGSLIYTPWPSSAHTQAVHLWRRIRAFGVRSICHTW